MHNRLKDRSHISKSKFLDATGVWLIVDGQFGSTGKGLCSSVLAETLGASRTPGLVTTNAGPNSGHTSYYNDEKVVLRQLPTFSVMSYKFHGVFPRTYLNHGAIIDPDVLAAEIFKYGVYDRVGVSPYAAISDADAKDNEKELVTRIGSTGKGTGQALSNKVMRKENAVADNWPGIYDGRFVCHQHAPPRLFDTERVLIEVSQGFSLSLNASGMYPYVTSRDCTVSQAMSDAGAHPTSYRGCMMVVRTHPIRVAGNSGPAYPDQHEITWENLGVPPEFTTVTNKMRRVFTWSRIQFREALLHNRPCSLFINFLQYLDHDRQEGFVNDVIREYRQVMGVNPSLVLLGFGALNENVVVYETN